MAELSVLEMVAPRRRTVGRAAAFRAGICLLGVLLSANAALAAKPSRDPLQRQAETYARAFPAPPAGCRAEAATLRSLSSGERFVDRAVYRELSKVYHCTDGTSARVVLDTDPGLAVVIALTKSGFADREKAPMTYRARGGLDAVEGADDQGRLQGVILEISPGHVLGVEVTKFGRDARFVERLLGRCDLGRLAATAEAMFRDSLRGPAWRQAEAFAGFLPSVPPGATAETPLLKLETHEALLAFESGLLVRTYRLADGATVTVILKSEELDDATAHILNFPCGVGIELLKKHAVKSPLGLSAFRQGDLDGMRGIDSQGRVTFACVKVSEAGVVLARAEPGTSEKDPVGRVLQQLDLAKTKEGLERKNGGVPVAPGELQKLDNAYLATLCRAHNGKACDHLALRHQSGAKGAKRDAPLAMGYFQAACREGEADACNEVGAYYWTGTGGLQANGALAAGYYGDACDRGSMTGCANLGAMYESGLGELKQDPVRAVSLYRKACEAGNPTGCANLGIAHQHGTGGLKVDPAAAVEHYRNACDADYPRGCQLLAAMYEEGLGGLTVDVSRARALSRKACKLGVSEACAGGK